MIKFEFVGGDEPELIDDVLAQCAQYRIPYVVIAFNDVDPLPRNLCEGYDVYLHTDEGAAECDRDQMLGGTPTVDLYKFVDEGYTRG